ncbi:MAG: hypothetical protein ACHQCI_07555, partial [Solirubrobacterales bacterium]
MPSSSESKARSGLASMRSRASLDSSSSCSLGTRQAYLEDLRAHLREHEAELSKEARERIDANPLRAFDSDDEGTKAV